MRPQPFRVAGDEVTINVVEDDADVAAFEAWLGSSGPILGLDTETTGLDIFTPGFRVRTVQLGDKRTAFVLRVELGGALREAAIRALARPDRRFVLHNAPFDALALDATGYARLEDVFPRMIDTYILAHLLDPRLENEGGVGLGLKALCATYVDPDAPDTAKGLYEVFRKDYKATKATGWALIDSDHPVYTLYAGLDVILVSRLLPELSAGITALGNGPLAKREHELALFGAKLERRGLLLDVDYTRGLSAQLEEDVHRYAALAARYGVDNVNSTRQVAAALTAMGEQLRTKTASGAPAVGKEVLLPLADLDGQWQRIEARTPNPLADAILRSKRAGKWRESYAEAFLALRDADDRVHPHLNVLAARTARMAVSRPPLQQLPSGDWTIRRCIIADDGNVIFGVDYKAMELRVLAALAGVAKMKEAISAGRDLHDFTAELVYGPGFTKAQRKVAKGVGLGKVFGGGAASLSQQTGAPLAQVKEAVAAYDEAYPEVNAFSRRLQRLARYGRSEVVTPSGRHIPLDRDRTYACVNYMVQSTARDVIAGALLRMDEAGLGDYILLPIHDETLGQAPAADAEEIVRAVAACMTTEFRGVLIEADADPAECIKGASWGEGYGAPPRRT